MITFRQFIERFEVPSKNLKDLVKKAAKRVDVDFDGDVDHNDTAYGGDYGAFVPSADGKKRLKAGPVKFAKESVNDRDNESEKERLKAEREEMLAKDKEKRKKEAAERAEKEAERQQADSEKNYVTIDDIEQAYGDAERSKGPLSWIDFLKKRKG